MFRLILNMNNPSVHIFYIIPIFRLLVKIAFIWCKKYINRVYYKSIHGVHRLILLTYSMASYILHQG
jgi:hypothetical protein